MWQVVGILAGLERSLRQERTKAGRATAQAWGVKTGRKPLQTTQQVAYTHKLVRQGESLVMLHNCSRYHGEHFIEPCNLWSNKSCVLPMKNNTRLIRRLINDWDGYIDNAGCLQRASG